MKTAQLTIRLSEHEKEALQHLASLDNRGVASYIIHHLELDKVYKAKVAFDKIDAMCDKLRTSTIKQ